MRIGVIAPPWIPVPPPAYGGTELMVDALCRGLTTAGHDVVLFTVGASTCPVERRSLFESTDPHRMGAAVEEFRHALAAHDSLTDVDVVHDHTLAGLFLGVRRDGIPQVTTVHGPFDEHVRDLYRRVASDVPIVAISHDQARRAPPDLPIARVIHHGIVPADYAFDESGGEHVVFLGRMSPDKGVETAIDVSRRAGRPLLIAAKLREAGERAYFESVIEPLLDGDVRFVGEADAATKVEMLTSAAALINPIRWPEPFGLVMIEALACGTPVVSGRHGAAPEIVDHGRTGFLADDTDELVAGLRRVDEIDRRHCRFVVERRFSAERMAADYLDLYREVVRGHRNNPEAA